MKQKITAVGIIIFVIGLVLWDQSLWFFDDTSEKLRTEAAQACLQRERVIPDYPFTSDNCTLSANGTWGHCCITHDVEYWCGGSFDARKHADQKLRTCMNEVVPLVGDIAYVAVRLGGSPYLPFPWRWGYGWPFFRSYR